MNLDTSISNASSHPTPDMLAGLTSEEVLASRAAHGSNVLTPRERTPWWRKFAEKFTDPLIIILLVAAVLSIGISFYEYFGLGAGFAMQVIKIDASYMIATAQNSPLDQTLRFTLSFDMDGIKDLFGRN